MVSYRLECVSSGTIRKFEWILRQFKEETRRLSSAKSRVDDTEMAQKTPKLRIREFLRHTLEHAAKKRCRSSDISLPFSVETSIRPLVVAASSAYFVFSVRATAGLGNGIDYICKKLLLQTPVFIAYYTAYCVGSKLYLVLRKPLTLS